MDLLVPMVDGIDGVGGPPYVCGTVRVDPAVEDCQDPLQDVWRRSPEARALAPDPYRAPLDLPDAAREL